MDNGCVMCGEWMEVWRGEETQLWVPVFLIDYIDEILVESRVNKGIVVNHPPIYPHPYSC